MWKYYFCSKLSIAEISSIVNGLPKINMTAMSKQNSFYGSVKGSKFCIGRTPNTLASNINFFCGEMIQSDCGTIVAGRFIPPLRLALFPYSVICVALVIIGGIVGLLVAFVGCLLLQCSLSLLLSINTKSKKDLLYFIADNFNAVNQKDK